jgi:biopolymer transport protein ExbD
LARVIAAYGSKCEPNLTPLLDMVLQLLMFFILCANFATTQVNENIKLPVMQSARPADKKDTELLFLNLRDDGTLEMLGQEPTKKPAAIRNYLRTYRDDTLRAQGTDDIRHLKTVIVLRADRETEYKDVFQLLHWCKEIGFRKYQIRAKTRADKASKVSN